MRPKSMVVGYKGQAYADAGFMYAPYMPLMGANKRSRRYRFIQMFMYIGYPQDEEFGSKIEDIIIKRATKNSHEDDWTSKPFL